MRWKHSKTRPDREAEMTSRMQLVGDLRAELASLLGSWEYAFAMGDGCAYGDHPEHRATRQRAADLRARIAELSD
jgi:hypothetical protein